MGNEEWTLTRTQANFISWKDNQYNEVSYRLRNVQFFCIYRNMIGYLSKVIHHYYNDDTSDDDKNSQGVLFHINVNLGCEIHWLALRTKDTIMRSRDVLFLVNPCGLRNFILNARKHISKEISMTNAIKWIYHMKTSSRSSSNITGLNWPYHYSHDNVCMRKT